MRIVSLSLALLALTAACNSKPESTTTSTTSAPSASASATVTAASASVAAALVTAAVARAVAAPVSSASGPPTWLKLGAGRSLEERIATGANTGCYKVKTENGEEIDCPPMTSPGATVDEVDLSKGRDCPAGFAASGADTCSRSCTKSADCHGKNICSDRQCQPKS